MWTNSPGLTDLEVWAWLKQGCWASEAVMQFLQRHGVEVGDCNDFWEKTWKKVNSERKKSTSYSALSVHLPPSDPGESKHIQKHYEQVWQNECELKYICACLISTPCIKWGHNRSKAWLTVRVWLWMWGRIQPKASGRILSRKRKQWSKHGHLMEPGHNRRREERANRRKGQERGPRPKRVPDRNVRVI